MNNSGRDSAAAFLPSDNNRNRKVVTRELDFFSSRPKNDNYDHSVNYPIIDSSNVDIKQEKSHVEAQMNVTVRVTYLSIYLYFMCACDVCFLWQLTCIVNLFKL